MASSHLLTDLSQAGGRLLTARTVASVGASLVEELRQLFDADHAARHLLTLDGQSLNLETYAPAEDFPLMLESGRALLPAAMEQASAVTLSDLAASRWAAEERGLVEAGIRSLLVVPMRGHYGPIGCATLLFRTPRAFQLWETGAVEALLLQAAAVIDRCRAEDGDVLALLEHLRDAYEQTLMVLADALQSRDPYMAGHARRSMTLALEIAERMALSPEQVRRIRHASLLRDIGYLAIPDAVLLKAGELTSEEWQMIRAHPAVGGKLIEGVEWLRDAVPLVVAHHERVDGDGYPAGIEGEEIPIGARVISVADAYLAMISPRAYRSAIDPAAALSEVRRGAGRQFDPGVVDVFLSLIESKIRA